MCSSVDISCQTDPFAKVVPDPVYVPAKTGVDNWSQVETELVFDFNRDTRLIVDAVTEKVMAQSRMEVREETELFNIRTHRREMQEQLNLELRVCQQLEEQEAQRAENKRQLLTDARARERKQAEGEHRAEASKFARR